MKILFFIFIYYFIFEYIVLKCMNIYLQINLKKLLKNKLFLLFIIYLDLLFSFIYQIFNCFKL